jgi:hypothetical protein
VTRASSARALFALGVALGGVLACERTARAAEGEITADTTAQFYDVRSPSGQNVLLRRRVTSTLGVTVYDLLPRPKEAGQELLPDLTFRARLRYDADYGAFGSEADPNAVDSYTPGFSRGPVDLMYAYVEGRRFLKGLLGFKLGRQYAVDSLGWWAFDGGLVRLTTPAYFAVEAYGGLEVRGGLPLSGPAGRWERDGVWRGDRDGFQQNAYPSFQQAAIAPAVGAAIESAGVSWLHGRLSYRRVWNTGESTLTQFDSGVRTPLVYDGTRISQERLGWSVMADWDKVGSLSGGLVYDLYSAFFSSVYASAEVRPTKRLTLGADYDYFRPTFDADSIWNFLGAQPMNDVTLRARVEPTPRLSVGGGGHFRVFSADGTPAPTVSSPIAGTPLPGSGASFAGGANVSLRYARWSSAVSVRALADFGDAGDRWGADVMGERSLGRVVLRARLGFWHWSDALRPERSADSIGTVLGIAYRFFHGSEIGSEIEGDANRLVGARFRWLAYLSLVVAR